MSPLQAPRGCPDIFPNEVIKRQFIIQTAQEIARLYGYQEHELPIFEHSDVFIKNLGADSDIVTKEMYELKEKGSEHFILRPEATASVARLFISNKLFREVPYKVFYSGPMFRHERPQKGRLRQFSQLGLECIGLRDVKADTEVIASAWAFITKLKLEKTSTLLINSLGRPEDRLKFRDHLVQFLSKDKAKLSEDSQKRLDTNPLRILDSKDEADQKILKEAPSLLDFLGTDSKAYFEELQRLLKVLKIPFTVDHRLVRGLDYYSDTVFEITNSDLGAQSTLLAGGRYDDLIKNMGGPDTPSIGWAAGLERLCLTTDFQIPKETKIGVIDMNHSSDEYLLRISETLRAMGHIVYWPHSGNFSKQIKKCEKENCSDLIIFGPDEYSKNEIQIKNLKTGLQIKSNFSKLTDHKF